MIKCKYCKNEEDEWKTKKTEIIEDLRKLLIGEQN